MSTDSTREPQYHILLDVKETRGVAKLGLMINEAWQQDPKRALFVLSRYKFVSKMLEGCANALEVGCADAFGTRLIQQVVPDVTAIDFDPLFIADVKERMDDHWPLKCFIHDMLEGSVPGKFEAVYSLDVLEHIEPADEALFLKNMVASLAPNGILICGTPSLESQTYASPQSKIGHINCKSGNELKATFKQYFNTVQLFSMNDEVVHTGYSKMAHYLFAVCSNVKKKA